MRPNACGPQQQEAARPSLRDLVRSYQELGPRGEGALLAAVEGGRHVGRDVATYRLALAAIGARCVLLPLAECSGIGPRVELAFEDGVAVVRDWAYVGAPSSVRAAIEVAVGPHPRSRTHGASDDPAASRGPLTTDQRRGTGTKPIGRCCPQCDVGSSAALVMRHPAALTLRQGGIA